MGAARAIVTRYLEKQAAKAAAEVAERAAAKAAASPVQLAKILEDEVHTAADAAKLHYDNVYGTPKQDEALQQWVEKRARSNELLDTTMKPQDELAAPRERRATTREPRKDLDYHKYKLEKNIESVEEAAKNPSTAALARESGNAAMKAEKAARMEAGIVDNEGTKVVSIADRSAEFEKYMADAELEKGKKGFDASAVGDNTGTGFKVLGAAAMPTMAPGFTNPLDMVKSGYNKFEAARKSVVDKVVDLTDMTATNPHVPQYAKDTYNKAATALVDNAVDPLNAIGGVGAIDAVMGTGGAAYDMYKSSRAPASTKPVAIPVDRSPMTNPSIKVNWKP